MEKPVDLRQFAPVTASVGRCDVSDLEPAAYSGGGVRLCGACFDREARRRARERRGTGSAA